MESNKTNRSVFVTLVVVIFSISLLGILLAGVSGATDNTSDRVIDVQELGDEDVFFGEQLTVTNGSDGFEGAVRIKEGIPGDDGDVVKTVRRGADGTISFEITDDFADGAHYLVDTGSDEEYGVLWVSENRITVSFTAIDNDTGTLSYTDASDHPRDEPIDLSVTAETISAAELETMFTESAIESVRTDGYDTLILENITSGEYDVDFSAIEPENIRFFFERVDTGATDNATVFREPDPVFDVSIPNDGEVYTVGFPGPINDTYGEIFGSVDHEGLAMYQFNSSEQAWQLMSGTDFDAEPTELDAVAIATTGNGTDTIRFQIPFKVQDVATPGSHSVSEGWNFVSASKVEHPETVFRAGSSDATVILDRFEGTSSPFVEDEGLFETQTGSNVYFVGSNESLEVNPFKGYFVFMQDDGELPSIVSGTETFLDVAKQLDIELE